MADSIVPELVAPQQQVQPQQIAVDRLTNVHILDSHFNFLVLLRKYKKLWFQFYCRAFLFDGKTDCCNDCLALKSMFFSHWCICLSMNVRHLSNIGSRSWLYNFAGLTHKRVLFLPMVVSCPKMSDDMRFPHTPDDWKRKKKMPKYWLMTSEPFLPSLAACAFPEMVRQVHLADHRVEPPSPSMTDVGMRVYLWERTWYLHTCWLCYFKIKQSNGCRSPRNI